MYRRVEFILIRLITMLLNKGNFFIRFMTMLWAFFFGITNGKNLSEKESPDLETLANFYHYMHGFKDTRKISIVHGVCLEYYL